MSRPPMSIVAEEAFVTPEILRAEQEEARAYLAKVRERHTFDFAAPIQLCSRFGATTYSSWPWSRSAKTSSCRNTLSMPSSLVSRKRMQRR